MRIFVCVHDEYHRRARAEWKHKIANAHPDRTPWYRGYAQVKGHTYLRQGKPIDVPAFVTPYARRNRGERVRLLIRRYRAWMTDERAWYAAYGLTPPTGR